MLPFETARRRLLVQTGVALMMMPVGRRAVAQVINGAIFPPPGTVITISSPSMAIDQFVLPQDCTINFAPGITSVDITCQKMVLNGQCTLDLRQQVPVPPKPPTPVGRPQNGYGATGFSGLPGAKGGRGADAIALNLSIQQLDGSKGSLWILTDGGPGGPGGDGGPGGKGGGPQTSGTHCYDGGNGGMGGAPGTGGDGGNTAIVKITLGPNTIVPLSSAGVAPSTRPASAGPQSGTIIPYGAPGPGGPGGIGGPGGPGGEGRACSWPASDAQPGRPGASLMGEIGPAGAPGRFMT